MRSQSHTNTANMSTILSITTDRKKGGIATALASYSAALAGHHHRHIVLLPSNAVAAAMLSGMSGVKLITMPAPAIRFHLMTGATFHPELRAATGVPMYFSSTMPAWHQWRGGSANPCA